MVPMDQVYLQKDANTGQTCNEVHDMWNGVTIQDRPGVQAAVVTLKPPLAIHLRGHVKR